MSMVKIGFCSLEYLVGGMSYWFKSEISLKGGTKNYGFLEIPVEVFNGKDLCPGGLNHRNEKIENTGIHIFQKENKTRKYLCFDNNNEFDNLESYEINFDIDIDEFNFLSWQETYNRLRDYHKMDILLLSPFWLGKTVLFDNNNSHYTVVKWEPYHKKSSLEIVANKFSIEREEKPFFKFDNLTLEEFEDKLKQMKIIQIMLNDSFCDV